jgi:hypothetical protein
LFGWLVVWECGAAFLVQVANDMSQGGSEMCTFQWIYMFQNFENLTKMAAQLQRYQVLLLSEKAASTPSTAVSHNGALKELSGSRLTGLMR